MFIDNILPKVWSAIFFMRTIAFAFPNIEKLFWISFVMTVCVVHDLIVKKEAEAPFIMNTNVLKQGIFLPVQKRVG